MVVLALILLKPESARDFNVRSMGQSVHIRAEVSRQYLGEPLRFKDEVGRNSCYDQNGELTVRCVDRFYGASFATAFRFDSDGVMTDTIRSVGNHPKVLPIPTTTRTVQIVNRQATVYRVFGYDESGMSAEDTERFRKIQEPFWLRIREDIALNDRTLVSLFWYQTLNEIRLERIESH